MLSMEIFLMYPLKHGIQTQEEMTFFSSQVYESIMLKELSDLIGYKEAATLPCQKSWNRYYLWL